MIQGNRIGTDVTGTAALGNLGGVSITGAMNNTIGGTAAAAANLIAFNGAEGVLVQGVLPTVSSATQSTAMAVWALTWPAARRARVA